MFLIRIGPAHKMEYLPLFLPINSLQKSVCKTDAYFFCQRLQPIDFGFILSNGGPQSLTNNYKLQK